MVHSTDQIVLVCAFLMNFQPAIVPPPTMDLDENNTDLYFEELSDCHSQVSVSDLTQSH